MSILFPLFGVAAPITAVVLVLLQASRWYKRLGKLYVPGPSGLPLLGNIFEIPVVGPWTYFETLGKKYGPMVRLTMAGDEMLVLNHPADCEELLAKRSTNYSSRKPLVYAGKYQSHDKRLVLLTYGEELKRQRAAFAEMLNPRAVASYESLHEEEASKLLYTMLASPADYKLNLKRFTASLVFTLTYGKKLNDDANLHAVLKILVDFLPDTAPGAHLVDSFPILDRLPDFLAPWRKQAKAKHAYESALYKRLVDEVKAEMDAGTADPCFTTSLWDQHARGKFDQETLAYVAGSAFEASIGTTSGTLLWFIVAMVLNPCAQQKAQAEIDGFLGGETGDLPSLAHMRNLPYCTALVKEVMRWMPVAPGAFPHYSDGDDEYKGYHIPKGTLVIPHVWAMHRNESLYRNALKFMPERFLGEAIEGEEALTSGHYTFGFGRRVCPARYLGARSVWIVAVRLLWAFRIEPALDKEGRPIPVDPYKATFNITSEPLDFPVRVTPRSEYHAQRIREEFAILDTSV